MAGFNTLQPLSWDADFFCKEIAKIDLKNITSNATAINTLIAESSFELIYCFAPQYEGTVDEITSVLNNAQWVDGKVTYVKQVEHKPFESNSSFRSVSAMEEGLSELAIQTGEYSRFNTDKKFNPDHYKRLYIKWIENSVNRSIADEVIVCQGIEKLNGLITIGNKNNRADIGLVGVDETARGKGIATKLLAFAENFAAKNNYQEIQVVTQQQNLPACRLYEKYGFSVESVVNIFHIWK